MKVLDQRNLPGERLSTTDEKGKRVYIFPEAVNGYYHKFRTVVQAVLIVIFLMLPWVKVGGHQALLFDVIDKKISIFGLNFWYHDAPLIFFILGILTIGLAFVTAVWGRIWCGWGCPQTVFIDGVFRRIERLVIGSHIKQKMLVRSPMNGSKLFKYSMKWFLFLLVSLLIAHSFLAYFVGAERIISMTQGDPRDHWTIFLFMLFITGAILFDFGWFREQFCIIMCPYGRFQSALLDENSVNVTYDFVRGEPRKGVAENTDEEGDCINCFKCVSVCPTGIDIREGLQLECIACTACMDACDEVMGKVDKPKGLIRYETEAGLSGKKTRFLRSRTVVYAALLIIFFSCLTYAVSKRQDVAYTVLRAKDSPFTVVKDSKDNEFIINHFKLHVNNQSFENKTLMLGLGGSSLPENMELITQNNTVNILPGQDTTMHFFIKFPADFISNGGVRTIDIVLTDIVNNKKLKKELKLVGPKSN